MAKTKAIAGGGAWMIAAALQVMPQTWPNLLHPHPWVVAVFVVAGAGMFAYAAFGHKGSDASKSQTARDVSGKMFQAESLHYHEAAPQVPQTPPQAPPIVAPVKPKPNLVMHRVRRIQPGKNYVYQTVPGEDLFVLPIENQLPGAKAGAVIASLRFFRFLTWNDLLGKADRAYWYDKYAHEIELERSETQQVVIGKFKDGRWFFFSNPHRHIPQFSHRSSDREPDTPESFELDLPAIMIIEIFNPYSHDEAYVSGRYLITPTANGCEVGEAP